MCGGIPIPVKDITAKLVYPHGEKLTGGYTEIGETIRVLSFPTGMAVGDVNVIAILETDGPFAKGWTVIDTGPDTETARDLWYERFDDALDGLPIKRVIVTHPHSDHIGLAGFLTKRKKAPLWIPRSAWYMACLSEQRAVEDKIKETEHFLKGCGYRRSMMDDYAAKTRDRARDPSVPLPAPFRPIEAGETIRIGGRDWEVIFAQGHAPDHAILLQKELGLAIVGDQILPTITPNVSVAPSEFEADPLDACLRSNAALAERLTDDVLIVPGHGAPFSGGQSRLKTIDLTHAKSLDRLLGAISDPITTIECFEAFYRRDLDAVNDPVALAQTRSYLNRLVYSGRARAIPRPDGVMLWSAA